MHTAYDIMARVSARLELAATPKDLKTKILKIYPEFITDFIKSGDDLTFYDRLFDLKLAPKVKKWLYSQATVTPAAKDSFIKGLNAKKGVLFGGFDPRKKKFLEANSIWYEHKESVTLGKNQIMLLLPYVGNAVDIGFLCHIFKEELKGKKLKIREGYVIRPTLVSGNKKLSESDIKPGTLITLQKPLSLMV